jgi:hypothetical protein
MKQLLMEYNNSHDNWTEETKCSFQGLNLDIIKRPEIFNPEDAAIEPRDVPGSIKRHAIEILDLFKQNEEEIILKNEMKQMFHHYRNDEAKIPDSINTISSNDKLSIYEIGALPFLKTEQQILEKHVLYIRFIYEFCTVS